MTALVQSRITAIGSCRIAGPLRRSQINSGSLYNRSGVYGYCHTSAEAVQMARHLVGEKAIPQGIWPLVSKSECRPDPHDPSDAYVVEISSAKSITLDGSPIQLNYLAGAYPAIFEDREVARQYWKGGLCYARRCSPIKRVDFGGSIQVDCDGRGGRKSAWRHCR